MNKNEAAFKATTHYPGPELHPRIFDGPLRATAPGRAPPTQGSLLGFMDSGLEQRYLEHEARTKRTEIAFGLAFAFVLVAVFYWFDPYLVAPQFLRAVHLLRLSILLPVCVLALGGFWLIKDPSHWIYWISSCLSIFGLGWTAILLTAGEGVFHYMSLALLQTAVGSYVLVGLPFRWAMSVAALMTVAFVIAASLTPMASHLLLPLTIPLVTVVSIATFGAYQYERASRRQFIAQAALEIEYHERLAAESSRSQWLGTIADFLRHELKNAMIGVNSSLELAQRVQVTADAQPYFSRAKRSIDFMRRMLLQASEATSLEAALAQQTLEPLDVSDLIAARVAELRDEVCDRKFSASIEPGILILGDANSLVQMLDKLVGNALEHGDARFPIRVEVGRRDGQAVVAISDIGDPLPADPDRMFEPFVSQKGSRRGQGNLGLGLYVARTIALRHGGHIRVEPLSDPQGVQVVVTLPAREPECA